MKSKNDIVIEIQKTEERLKKEEEFLKSMPSIAFQRGEADYDARDRYKIKIEVLKWVMEEI